MSKPSRIRTPLILLATVGTVLALSAGCSKQGEGERCSLSANGSEDCDDGLVCTAESELGPTAGGVNRCCPPKPPYGDDRCLPKVGGPGSGGSGSGGQSGSGGSSDRGGGSSEGGSSEGGLTSTGGVSSSGGDTSSSSGGGVTGGAGGA